jgi:uncharacterized protein (TIGR00369 family)
MSEGASGHGIPHGEALGILCLERSARRAACRLPWRADLVGHPAIGSIFSGAVWALLDQTLGTACFEAVGPLRAVATIDLRVDYLRPSRGGRALLALGECTRLTRQVAFARGTVHHEDEPEAEPLALAQGTFMIYERPPEWTARRA